MALHSGVEQIPRMIIGDAMDGSRDQYFEEDKDRLRMETNFNGVTLVEETDPSVAA